MALTPGWSVLQGVIKSAGARSLVFSPKSRYRMLFTVLVALSIAASKMSQSTLTLRGPCNPERICFMNFLNMDILFSATFLNLDYGVLLVIAHSLPSLSW